MICCIHFSRDIDRNGTDCAVAIKAHKNNNNKDSDGLGIFPNQSATKLSKSKLWLNVYKLLCMIHQLCQIHCYKVTTSMVTTKLCLTMHLLASIFLTFLLLILLQFLNWFYLFNDIHHRALQTIVWYSLHQSSSAGPLFKMFLDYVCVGEYYWVRLIDW